MVHDERKKRVPYSSSYERLVFVLLFASPTFLFKPMEVSNLGAPEQITYQLWLPGIAPIDLALLPLVLIIANRGFCLTTLAWSAVFFGIHLVAFLTLLINNYNTEFYDGVLYAVRYLLLAFLVHDVYQRSPAWAIKALVVICCSLVTISLVAVAVFDYEGVFGGRINLLGLGVNTSSDLLVLVMLLTYYHAQKGVIGFKYATLMLVAGTLFLPLTGGRRGVIYLILVIIMFAGRFKRVVNFWSVSGSVLIFAIAALQPLVIEFFVGGLGRLSDSIGGVLSGDFVDGRMGMYQGAFSVVENNLLGVGLSDWAIQIELVRNGAWGSHTHNFFLQTYLRLGPLSIVLLYFLAATLVFSVRGSAKLLMLVMLVSMMTGYGFWNLKYFSIFAFACIYIWRADKDRNLQSFSRLLQPESSKQPL